MSELSTTQLDQKLKLLNIALQRPVSWYSGIAIKRYLKEKIFKLDTDFNNRRIQSGAWTTYCHYSLIRAFNNLLDKNHITSGSRVLINPLLPSVLVQELLNRDVDFVCLDVDKTNLSFQPQEFSNFLQRYGGGINLVINYGFNGLYQSVSECIKIAQNLIIPTLFIVDNFDINLSLLQVFSDLEMGGVIWSFGDSFWDEQLDLVLDVNLTSQNWFVSWQIENRTRSILEYHLSDSHEVYFKVIEAFFFLLLEKYKKQNLFGHLWQATSRRFQLKNKFANSTEAINTIKENYLKIFDSAVPDVVFDLQNVTPVKFRDQGHSRVLIEKNSEIQFQSKRLYTFFYNFLSNRPQGSLEIPDFYLDQAYLKYFLYTTEAENWNSLLSPQGFQVETLPRLHPKILEQPQANITNAKFVTDYGLLIDVPCKLNYEPKI